MLESSLKSICTMPFFNGKSTAANSIEKLRIDYLKTSIDNHFRIFDEIYVGVSNEDDYKIVNNLNTKATCIIINCNPIFLPAFFLEKIKDISFDLIYYSEADQKLFCSIFSEIVEVLKENNNVFFVPRRFFKVNYKPIGLERIYSFSKPRITLQAHSNNSENEIKYNKNFYIEKNKFKGFGGAWFTSRYFFETINFKKSKSFPIEQTSGFDLFETTKSLGLMTNDPFDFWVEHLSGCEFFNKKKMLSI